MAERFYLNDSLAVGPVFIQGPEARHMTAVCRLRPGDRVCLFNGDGCEYPAEITSCDRRCVELNVLAQERIDRELPFRLIVASPLPKGDRGQFLIEKLAELGVASYVPLRTERSVVHPGDARAEKLARYVIEASKQCRRNVLMSIEDLANWREFLGKSDLPGRKFIAHPRDEPWTGSATREDSVVAVGPEGGFSEAEVEMARAAGWRVVDLGPRILRVETAAIAIAASMLFFALQTPRNLPHRLP